MWNVETRAAVGEPLIGHTDGVWFVAFSPDGTQIVSGSDDNAIRVWNVEARAAVGELCTLFLMLQLMYPLQALMLTVHASRIHGTCCPIPSFLIFLFNTLFICFHANHSKSRMDGFSAQMTS